MTSQSLRFAGLLLVFAGVVVAQSPGDFSITYGVNYSTADRKGTAQPGIIGPASVLYRPNCRWMFGADDDTFVTNKTATGSMSGTGDLAFEGHLTLWHGGLSLHDKCASSTRASIRLDEITTVPVAGTLESTEVASQTKLTWLLPVLNPVAQHLALWTVSGGVNVAGVPSGGRTENGVMSVNYTRYFQPDGAWGVEGEVDLGSSNKLGPSSAIVLFAIDGALDKAQKWGMRFGASAGVTPYAPKFSPFFQLTYSDNISSIFKSGGASGLRPLLRRLR